MIRYCLPIVTAEPARAVKIVDENCSRFEYFEFWLDYLEDGALRLVEEMSFRLGEKAIFLLRRHKLENIRMPLEKRYRLIEAVADTNSYLDLDVNSQAQEIDFIRSQKLSPALLLSYHNYEATPDLPLLREILERMASLEGRIFKLATFCNTREDALSLLTLTLELCAEGERFIVLGMGTHGQVTRVFGGLWGNQLTYAPLDAAGATAPGQLTRDQFDLIYSQLKDDGRK